jgi:hypothetical protein
MSTTLSPAMQLAMNSVIASQKTNEFIVDFTILNDDDATYKYSPEIIDKIVIGCKYIETITDAIYIYFKVAPTDYINLYKNLSNIRISMVLTYKDPITGEKDYTKNPIKISGIAMLKNPKDLYKEYSPEQLHPTDQVSKVESHVSLKIPVELHVVNFNLYAIKQIQFHTTFTKTYINDALGHIAKALNISNMEIKQSDNTYQWEYIVIPPAYDISNIFTFLQNKYGVYNKGCCWYYTNDDVLYVYPSFETNPNNQNIAKIYNVPDSVIKGSKNYHKITNDVIEIVSNSKVSHVDKSQHSAENGATSYSFVRQSSILDNFVNNDSGQSSASVNNTLTVATAKNRTLSSINNNNDKFIQNASDNLCMYSSRIAEGDCSMISCEWFQCIPLYFRPGHRIEYYFDNNGAFSKQTGILDGVIYKIEPVKRQSSELSYSAKAKMVIRASSDITALIS